MQHPSLASNVILSFFKTSSSSVETYSNKVLINEHEVQSLYIWDKKETCYLSWKIAHYISLADVKGSALLKKGDNQDNSYKNETND